MVKDERTLSRGRCCSNAAKTDVGCNTPADEAIAPKSPVKNNVHSNQTSSNECSGLCSNSSRDPGRTPKEAAKPKGKRASSSSEHDHQGTEGTEVGTSRTNWLIPINTDMLRSGGLALPPLAPGSAEAKLASNAVNSNPSVATPRTICPSQAYAPSASFASASVASALICAQKLDTSANQVGIVEGAQGKVQVGISSAATAC